MCQPYAAWSPTLILFAIAGLPTAHLFCSARHWGFLWKAAAVHSANIASGLGVKTLQPLHEYLQRELESTAAVQDACRQLQVEGLSGLQDLLNCIILSEHVYKVKSPAIVLRCRPCCAATCNSAALTGGASTNWPATAAARPRGALLVSLLKLALSSLPAALHPLLASHTPLFPLGYADRGSQHRDVCGPHQRCEGALSPAAGHPADRVLGAAARAPPLPAGGEPGCHLCLFHGHQAAPRHGHQRKLVPGDALVVQNAKRSRFYALCVCAVMPAGRAVLAAEPWRLRGQCANCLSAEASGHPCSKDHAAPFWMRVALKQSHLLCLLPVMQEEVVLDAAMLTGGASGHVLDSGAAAGSAGGTAAGTASRAQLAAHRGFLTRARGVPIDSLYREARARGKRLVLCGHSLGGAVASLCALQLLQHLPPNLHHTVR